MHNSGATMNTSHMTDPYNIMVNEVQSNNMDTRRDRFIASSLAVNRLEGRDESVPTQEQERDNTIHRGSSGLGAA